jgi:hypothetical protein
MLMKLRSLLLQGILVLTVIVTLSGCGSGGGGGSDVIQGYSGSASYGDIITYSIDSTKKVYTIHNETTGATDSHSYIDSANSMLTGVKEVTFDGNTYYAVELDGKIIVTNFPSGNSSNKVCFGVSSALDNTGLTNQFAGDYAWIQLKEDATPYRAWGGLTIYGAGTYGMKGYSSNLNPLESTSIPFPLSDSSIAIGADHGTWVSDGTHKERVNVHSETLTPSDYTGFAYVSADSTVFLMDLGIGNGFMLGVKNPSSQYTPDQIAGTYKFVDVDNNGIGGSGSFVIDLSGDASYYHIDQSGNPITGNLTSIHSTSLNNTFYYSAGNNRVYLIFTGSIIAILTTDQNGNFISYGAGAKM